VGSVEIKPSEAQYPDGCRQIPGLEATDTLDGIEFTHAMRNENFDPGGLGGAGIASQIDGRRLRRRRNW